MLCMSQEASLWGFMFGIVVYTLLLYILVLARVVGFPGSSSRHAHFSQLSNSRVHELSGNHTSIRRGARGQQDEDAALHVRPAVALGRPTCVPGATAGNAAAAGSLDVRAGPQTGAPTRGCVRGAEAQASRGPRAPDASGRIEAQR